MTRIFSSFFDFERIETINKNHREKERREGKGEREMNGRKRKEEERERVGMRNIYRDKEIQREKYREGEG
jgi:hypothetical protein